MPTRREVSEFLTQFKLSIEYERCYFKDRNRLEQDLINLNLIRKQAMEIICNLSPDNYSKGPEPDDTDQTKDIWVFGYQLEDTVVYIKLRLNPAAKDEMPRGTIWSFHAAEYKLKFPLQGERS